MFNGIIQETGDIVDINLNKKSYITFVTKLNLKNCQKGSSISCDGICLTIIKINKIKKLYNFTVNVSNETINRTTIKYWKKNQKINIEKSIKFNQEISGHFVYGHVDGISKILDIKKLNNSLIFKFKYLNNQSQKFILEKGSVSINGISLTIAKKFNDSFSVSIIPHTYKVTNLSSLKISNKVNIEYDMLARYIFNK